MRIGLLLSCLLLLAAVVDAKDLVVRQRSSSGFGGGTAVDETVYITTDKIITDAAAMRTIVDLDKQNLTSIDKAQKTYAVISFDELRKQMDLLRQSLDSMPPEARKQMAALFDDSQPVVIKETGKTETIAGHSAKEHSLSGGPGIPRGVVFSYPDGTVSASLGGAPSVTSDTSFVMLIGFPPVFMSIFVRTGNPVSFCIASPSRRAAPPRMPSSSFHLENAAGVAISWVVQT